MAADISSDLSGGVKDFPEDFAGIWLDIRVGGQTSHCALPRLGKIGGERRKINRPLNTKLRRRWKRGCRQH